MVTTGQPVASGLHTAFGTDLAAMAAGAGIKNVRTVVRQADIPEAASLLRQNRSVSFVLLKVKPTDPPKIRRSNDAALTKYRFRQELLGI